VPSASSAAGQQTVNGGSEINLAGARWNRKLTNRTFWLPQLVSYGARSAAPTLRVCLGPSGSSAQAPRVRRLSATSESDSGQGSRQPRPSCIWTLLVGHALPRRKLYEEAATLAAMRLKKGAQKMNGEIVYGCLVILVFFLGLPDLTIRIHHLGLDPLLLPLFTLLALLMLPLSITIAFVTLEMNSGMMLPLMPMMWTAAQQEPLQYQQWQTPS
jgi:hypothetical protein